MKKIFAVLTFASLLCLPAEAKIVRGYASSSDNVLTFSVDSIDYRYDLTRVYGKVTGRPHTSNRIDAVRMTGGNNSVDATDIDGVDFKRYFQWEDDGKILLEIDFPACTPTDQMQFRITTAHGLSTTTAKRTTKKH